MNIMIILYSFQFGTLYQEQPKLTDQPSNQNTLVIQLGDRVSVFLEIVTLLLDSNIRKLFWLQGNQ